MDFVTEDMLSGELIPVILGLSPEALQTAQRMYRRYNVVSHVFCNKLPLPLRFSLCMKYHVVHATEGEQLMLHALREFSEQLNHADVILYLIPCTEPYANLVWEHRDELECRFVIADKPEMYRVWFGEEIPMEKGGQA